MGTNLDLYLNNLLQNYDDNINKKYKKKTLTLVYVIFGVKRGGGWFFNVIMGTLMDKQCQNCAKIYRIFCWGWGRHRPRAKAHRSKKQDNILVEDLGRLLEGKGMRIFLNNPP